MELLEIDSSLLALKQVQMHFTDSLQVPSPSWELCLRVPHFSSWLGVTLLPCSIEELELCYFWL